MALAASKSQLAVLCLLLLSVHAGLSLDRWDLRAVLCIAGVQSHSSATTGPCNLRGVVCERRLSSDDGSNVLRITRLVLKSQRLKGYRSPSIRRLSALKELTMADNELVGRVTSQITECSSLKGVDVQLSDSGIPKRYALAENLSPTSTRSKVSASIPASLSPSPSAIAQKHHKKNKRKSIQFSILVGGTGGSIIGFFLLLLFKLIVFYIRGGGKKPGPVIFSSQIKKAEDLAFLEKEDGLAALEVIGSGGCGEVYKAQLPGSNGMVIAIKKIIDPPEDATELNEKDSKVLNNKMRQIQSEIRTVGQIRHRNLVPLLAYLPRPNCHYLVYEFMKNGSLQDVLKQVSQGSRDLDWPARHRIAVGVASGLEYLHMDHGRRIIHRDLKPANVLLDDDMEARITDFALAKAMPGAKTHITTSIIAGTMGYIAPEYYQTLQFTEKCDIYSFGILLGALVMGKLPSDEFFLHVPENGPVSWLRKVMTSDNPSEAIDPKLIGNGFEEQMLLVLKIACHCTLENPNQRPNSKDVRCMLSQTKK